MRCTPTIHEPIVLTLPPAIAVLSTGRRPLGSCSRAAGYRAAISCFGTFRTWRDVCVESVMRSKSEVARGLNRPCAPVLWRAAAAALLANFLNASADLFRTGRSTRGLFPPRVSSLCPCPWIDSARSSITRRAWNLLETSALRLLEIVVASRVIASAFFDPLHSSVAVGFLVSDILFQAGVHACLTAVFGSVLWRNLLG
jgi:hypothetical protein